MIYSARLSWPSSQGNPPIHSSRLAWSSCRRCRPRRTSAEIVNACIVGNVAIYNLIVDAAVWSRNAPGKIMIVEFHISMDIIVPVHVVEIHVAFNDPSVYVHIFEAVINVNIRNTNVRSGACNPAAATPPSIEDASPVPVAVIVQP